MSIFREYQNECAADGELTTDLLTDQLEFNCDRIGRLFGDSPDLMIRGFSIRAEKTVNAAIIYLENLVDKNRISEDIIRQLADDAANIAGRNCKPAQIGEYLKTQWMTLNDPQPQTTFSAVADHLVSGDTILLIDGTNEAFSLNTRGWAQREISNPETELTIRGPRECFVETLGTNVALLRRRIGHPDLTIEPFQVGVKTKTRVNIVYLKGTVNLETVAEVRRRLARAKTNAILGSGHLEQFIGDAPLSPFPTFSYSERPDVVAAKILQGRVAIVIDGSPEVLTVPALFTESFWTADDLNTTPFYSILMRVIRYIAFGISILGPGVYIALSSFHQELIPTPLFIMMAAGVEGAPFPVFVEVIIIGLIFEIFREAGIRLPRPVGQAITFVSALVVAQSSIAMGLVGVSTVVVVSFTAIASLVIPNQANVSILIRLLLAIFGSIFGFYGILIGLLYVLAHAASLRSFGIPCLYPAMPFNLGDFKKEVILITPLWERLGELWRNWKER